MRRLCTTKHERMPLAMDSQDSRSHTFRADARGLRAAQVKPVPFLLQQEVVPPFRPPPVLLSQWRQSRRPPPPLLAAWPRMVHRLKLVVLCAPLCRASWRR